MLFHQTLLIDQRPDYFQIVYSVRVSIANLSSAQLHMLPPSYSAPTFSLRNSNDSLSVQIFALHIEFHVSANVILFLIFDT